MFVRMCVIFMYNSLTNLICSRLYHCKYMCKLPTIYNLQVQGITYHQEIIHI